MWVAFALQKLLTSFQQKIQHICISLNVTFNESLTYDVVSFEQLGPGFFFFSGRILNSQKFLHADNEDSDQTARMRRLIWVFVGRTCKKVRFLTFRLKWLSQAFSDQKELPVYLTLVMLDKLRCHAHL